MAQICPVCNKKTSLFDEVYKQGVAIHGSCTPEFDKDPEKYGGKSGAAIAEAAEKQQLETKVAIEKHEELQQKIEDKSVYVKGFSMPFGEMVEFMVKWAIASIPAFIILFIIFGILFLIFGSLFF